MEVLQVITPAIFVTSPRPLSMNGEGCPYSMRIDVMMQRISELLTIKRKCAFLSSLIFWYFLSRKKYR